MKKHFLLLIIIAITSSIYLNWSYSRIYNKNETILGNIPWPQQISFPNPNFQNQVKYVAMGDSLTFGVGSNNIHDTLPYVFANKLSNKMSVSLINLASSGATTDDLINSQLDKATSDQPNYITLLIGINDIHNNVTAKKFQQDMELILSRLTQVTKAKIIVFNIPYLGSSNLILPPFNIYFDYKTRQFNKILTGLTSKYNLTLIDLYDPTKNFSNQTDFYSSDKFHPQGAGYRLWGQLINENNL